MLPGFTSDESESSGPDGAEQISASGRSWSVASVDEAGVDTLASEAQLPSLLARLLWLSGLRTGQEVASYLHPSTAQLHDPFLLTGMQDAVDRIVGAVQREEPMLIYGDYDVDGTLATVLLKTAIDRITPRGRPSLVRYHIPHRIREGYGVQASVLATAATDGIRLVISVDTGIRAFAAADEAAALGLDLIVTDHHLPESRGNPKAVAVINPNQAGCAYPEKHLCGAAVAWKLSEALLRSAGQASSGLQPVDATSFGKLQRSFLKLVAIATIADAVPLTGENRVIAALGLAELRDVRQPGLRALMRLAQVGSGERAPLASEVAFRIAPRINAAGRMDVASDVVCLLLTRDPAEAEVLANRLHSLNEERRNVEGAILVDLHQQIDRLVDVTGPAKPGIFVLDGHDWHRGVIGILASRVVDRTQRPALVITHHEGAAHGSGRSVQGFHLLDALSAVHADHFDEEGEDLLLRFGGHAHAVGFSLSSALVPTLRRRMLAHATEHVPVGSHVPPLQANAALPLHQAGPETWQWVNQLQPFGNGNEEPVFLASGVRVVDMRVLKERHLKLRVQPDQGSPRECLCWARTWSWPQRAEELGVACGSMVDLLYQVRWNDRQDFGGFEIHVCDLRRSLQEPDSVLETKVSEADLTQGRPIY